MNFSGPASLSSQSNIKATVEPFFKGSGRSTATASSKPSTTADVDSEHLEERRKTQLARQAALLTIQLFWRGILTRRKFLSVMHFGLSHEESSGGTVNTWPNVEDLTRTLTVQEKLIRRYHRYCIIFERGIEKEFRLPPSFPFYCATYIQAHFRMRRLRRAYLEYKSSPNKGKDNSFLLGEMKRMGGHEDILITYNSCARRIQAVWKSFYV